MEKNTVKMKTFANIGRRAVTKWIFVSGILVLFASCGDIYDNIKDFSVEEIVYPAKFDTIYGAAGFERVEIDLCSAGRIPSGRMNLGKAERTIVEYIAHDDTVRLVFDSVCSWLNITGLDEPKLYSFKIYTSNGEKYGDLSVPKTIDLTPYTSQDRDALGLAPPLTIESTSSVLVEWRSRLSSATVFNFYSYEYSYRDRDDDVHTGEGEGDLPSFFVENIRKGEITSINMKCRVQPVLNGRLILDTIDWEPTLSVNISDAAVPALFLKSPAAATSVDFPVKFEWVMTDEVSDYTLKLSRNSGFLPGETYEINAGSAGEYDLAGAVAQEVSDSFGSNVMNLYWTVVPTTPVAGIRTQFRQLQVTDRHPLAVADVLDIVFEADGTARDVAFSTERVKINRIKGSDPLDIIYNEEYGRYMARLNPGTGIGSSPNVNQASFYQADYDANMTFRNNLSNTHSIEVVAMLDEDFPLPSSNNNEVKIFVSMGGGGTGIQLTNRGAGNEFTFQPHINGGWRTLRSGVTPERGRYYHVVGTWDKITGKICIYVDGELKGEMTQTGNFTFPSNAPRWFATGGQQAASGSLPYITAAMKGDLVVARIHSKALTAEEVASLYRQL
ncbi:MAG: hypothetical protein LBL33_07070 [Tannerella sp.]|nr:hypothetical protein [Tannerella sp.]